MEKDCDGVIRLENGMLTYYRFGYTGSPCIELPFSPGGDSTGDTK